MTVNIEKKISHIWVGPKPAPLKWMHTWRDKHPEWEYTVFTDHKLRNRAWRNQALIETYYNAKAFCGVSDLISLYQQLDAKLLLVNIKKFSTSFLLNVLSITLISYYI